MKEVKLGWEVKDRLTGVTGIVTGITKWLTGCDTVGVKPQGVDDKMQQFEAVWFDDSRVQVIKKHKKSKWVDLEDEEPIRQPKKNGGPQDTPRRQTA